MDKWNAIHKVWNSFGLKAYDENTVPDDATAPYITYQASVAQFDEDVPLVASIWYKSNSWAEVSQKADEISDYIGGGAGVNYDGGRLWIRRAIPFAQRLEESGDRLVRRIILQITAEFQ